MSEPSPSRPLAGIIWMLVTGLCFVGVTALVKVLGPRMPAAEAAFLRYLLGLALILPMLWRLNLRDISLRMHGFFAARGLLHSIGVGCWFFAMARIPIAEVTALNYLAPIYVTIGAALFLGEKLALRRLLAIVAALVGAMIILQPGFREIGPGQITMLFTGVTFGGSYLIAKYLADRTDAALVVAMLSIWVTIGLAPAAAMNWIWPNVWELGLLVCIAALATFGHYTMTLALKAAPIAVTQPITFLQLIWATALGALVFAEPIDGWVVLGGSVILGAVCYIAWREAQLKRRAITPAIPATKY
ncbi:MAG: DMT family transporter [Pseudomonadota bacterium]